MSGYPNIRLPAAATLVAFSSLCAATVTYAGESAADDITTLDEVVITAQKRAQNLQDVGVAVTAVDNQMLDLVGKQDIKGLVSVVPSLQVLSYSPSQTVFNIRGISQNDFSDSQEGPVAFYNDEVYVANAGAIYGQSFDLERVEVLRGPQGTLFGRNATGGLVHVISAKPSKDTQGYVSVNAGSRGQFGTEAALGGPISDHVRGRLALTSDRNHGYVRSAVPGLETGGDANFYGLRGQLEFDVGSNGLLRLKAEHLRNKNESANASSSLVATQDSDGLGVLLPRNVNAFGTCNGCTPFGFIPNSDPFINDATSPGIFDRTYWSGTATYEHDFGTVKLTAVSNYQDMQKLFEEDVDGSPFPAIEVRAGLDLQQYSQELRLAGDTGSLNWVVGLYGLKIKSTAPAGARADAVLAEFFAGVPIGTFYSEVDLNADTSTRTLAAFAQGEFRLNDVFSVIAGARQTSDRKKYAFQHFVFGFPDYSFEARHPDLTTKKFSNWSGKLELDAKPNDNTLLYASVNRGIKGGGFNSPVLVPNIFQIALDPFNPTPAELAALEGLLQGVDAKIIFGEEVLTNFEGGAKLTLADGRVHLNSSLFHYRYKGYQAFQIDSGSSFIVNLPARLSGAEVELAARPVPRLNLSAFVTSLFKAKIPSVQLPGDGFTPGRFVERRMPLAPKWSAGATLAYDFPLAEYGALTLATNWKYDSELFFSSYNVPLERESSRVFGSVRASFAPASGNWELAAAVNNVTDKRYRYSVADNSFSTTSEHVYARPRWYSATVTYRFEN